MEPKVVKSTKAAPKVELAGGHADAFRFLPDGSMLKAGKKSELAFFRDLENKASPFAHENELLRPFMPEYLGIVNEGGKQWIHMHNITHGLTHCSFMDIKMNDLSYSPDDPADKVKKHIERDKLTTTAAYGMRITGFTIKDAKGEVAGRMIKEYEGTSLEDTCKNVEKFLRSNGAAKINKEATKYYIATMQRLKELFEKQLTRKFIASSLLFALSNLDNKFDVKLIDFAHVIPQPPVDGKPARDQGYIKGLNTLIKVFSDVLAKSA